MPAVPENETKGDVIVFQSMDTKAAEDVKSTQDLSATRKRFACHECDHFTSRKSDLLAHLRQHLMEMTTEAPVNQYKGPFQCEGDCLDDMSESQSIDAKVTQDLKSSDDRLVKIQLTTRKRFPCHECDYFTSRKASLLDHLRKTLIPIQCDRCAYFASDECDLRSHYRIHTRQRPFRCGECNYATNQSVELRAHVDSIHSTEEIFRCDECDFWTFRKFNLDKHLSIHLTKHTTGRTTGQASFKCFRVLCFPLFK